MPFESGSDRPVHFARVWAEEIPEDIPSSGPPIKVDPGQEDELSRRIKSTLGDFNQVQRLLSHDPNHLIGISRTNAAAQARAPPAVSNPVNGSSSTASTWNGNATGWFLQLAILSSFAR
ncbi:hypothetical protein MRX96_022739 [Rhipicephalus microplus]